MRILATDKNLESAFKLLDRDNDGKLTINDFKTSLGEAPVEDEKWQTLLKEADLDNDGTITLTEFKQAVNKFIK